MLKRCVATGLLLGLGALVLIMTSAASASVYKRPSGKDCGKAAIVGGFGGPRPTNVSANAIPQVDTFIVRGTISCATAKQVMNKFEKSFAQPGAASKGISPSGWKCAFSASLKGQSCSNSKHVVISNGLVWVAPK